MPPLSSAWRKHHMKQTRGFWDFSASLTTENGKVSSSTHCFFERLLMDFGFMVLCTDLWSKPAFIVHFRGKKYSGTPINHWTQVHTFYSAPPFSCEAERKEEGNLSGSIILEQTFSHEEEQSVLTCKLWLFELESSAWKQKWKLSKQIKYTI